MRELGITRQTLYRFVGPKGEIRSDGLLEDADWRRIHGGRKPVVPQLLG